MSIEIRLLREGDAHLLERVDPDVFDHEVQAPLVAHFLADPRHHLVVAMDGDLVIGMASALDYIHPDKPVQLWINEMGVATSHRRRGIGRRLLDALLEHARTLGCEEVWVATEIDNEPARALYLASGGQEEQAVVYTYSLANGAPAAGDTR
jgi:aminoglycoside 6'-N-acetyltransferase I